MGKGADDKCTYKTRNTNSSGNCDIKEKTVEKKKEEKEQNLILSCNSLIKIKKKLF